ncbi:MAG: hypothetical protein K6G26_06105, partial [Lachnospiraceae bacterium]|nr:hypothetical protein [Lachnospiraceae bacterium]
SHISINVLNCRELITENNMIRKKNAVLKVNEMICKDVHVENVTCNYLYGENVTIGDNCNIKVLEYSDSLTNNGKSKIGKVNKVDF